METISSNFQIIYRQKILRSNYQIDFQKFNSEIANLLQLPLNTAKNYIQLEEKNRKLPNDLTNISL